MVRLFVEAVPQVYLCCDTLLTAADIASASRFQNSGRRNEHLAWRRIVRRELGRDITIEYNDVGAPIVTTPTTTPHISVAHSQGIVAVAIADEPVGIDIESVGRDFSRAATRYMRSEECELCEDELWMAMVWTAKEAMYKYYGVKGIDLRDDLRITAYDATTRRMCGELRGKEAVDIDISLYDEEYIVATAVSKQR